MKLSGLEVFVLQALYKAPGQSGDVVAILGEKGVAKDNAQAVGRELERYGLIDYVESRAYGDATLNETGIEYIKRNKIYLDS